jgi:hypothetical protein
MATAAMRAHAPITARVSTAPAMLRAGILPTSWAAADTVTAARIRISPERTASGTAFALSRAVPAYSRAPAAATQSRPKVRPRSQPADGGLAGGASGTDPAGGAPAGRGPGKIRVGIHFQRRRPVSPSMIRSGSSGRDSGRGGAPDSYAPGSAGSASRAAKSAAPMSRASASARLSRSAATGRPIGQRGTSRPSRMTVVSSSRSMSATALSASAHPAGLSITGYASSGGTGWTATTVA